MFSNLNYDYRDWTTGVTSQADDNDLYLDYDDDNDDWPISKPMKTLYTVLYTTVFTIGAIGNTLVMMVFLKTKEMRNSINIMLVNLAVADILILVIQGARELYPLKMGLDLSNISEIWCYAVPFLEFTVSSASVLTILAISVERYYAVCHPLKAVYICTNKRAYTTCLLVWAIAILYSSLQFSFKIYVPEYTGSSDGPPSQPGCWARDSLFKTSYYAISASTFFLLPLVVFIVLFTIIVRHLNVTVAPNVNIAAIRHRRHVTTMLAIVVLCFFLCQLPHTVRYLVYAVAYEEMDRLLGVRGYNNVLYFTRFMLYLHSAINPVLYNFMSERLRAGFKNNFSCMGNGCSRWQRA